MKNLKNKLLIFAVLASMTALTGCSSGRRDWWPTAPDGQVPSYLLLKKGESWTAPRNVTLASEPVIQDKDEQILILQRTLEKLIKEKELSHGGNP